MVTLGHGRRSERDSGVVRSPLRKETNLLHEGVRHVVVRCLGRGARRGCDTNVDASVCPVHRVHDLQDGTISVGPDPVDLSGAEETARVAQGADIMAREARLGRCRRPLATQAARGKARAEQHHPSTAAPNTKRPPRSQVHGEMISEFIAHARSMRPASERRGAAGVSSRGPPRGWRVPTLCSVCLTLRPNGAAECSHGWSAARVFAGEAQPVERVASSRCCPGGAEEACVGALPLSLRFLCPFGARRE